MSYALIMYPLIQRGLISTWVEVSKRSGLCYIQCSLSKQVRVTPSDDRGKNGSTWISPEFLPVSLWTQNRNECPPGQRSGESPAEIKAWLRGPFGVKLQQEKSPLLLCDLRYKAYWMLKEQQWERKGKGKGERLICIGVHGLPTQH